MRRFVLLCVALAGVCAVLPCQAESTKTYVRYYPGGGTGSMSDQKVESFSYVKLKTNKFKRPGYLFTGWYDFGTGAVYKEKEVVYVGFLMELYAKWEYDEWEWLDKAHVFAGYITSDSTDAYGTFVLKTGKRNSRTHLSKFTATVVWPGTTKKVTLKGESFDGTAYLSGGGYTVLFEADATSCRFEYGDTAGDGHIAGKEGEGCMLRGSFIPSTYSCVALPSMYAQGTKWKIPSDSSKLRLSFKKGTFEFTGSYTDNCGGKKIKMKVAGVAFDQAGIGYAYGDGNVYPFELIEW